MKILRSIEHEGTYAHTADELEYGARVAWRNAAKCANRKVSLDPLQHVQFAAVEQSLHKQAHSSLCCLAAKLPVPLMVSATDNRHPAVML